jgi:hypothetical protein
MYNEMTYFNGVAEKVEDLIPLIDIGAETRFTGHINKITLEVGPAK